MPVDPSVCRGYREVSLGLIHDMIPAVTCTQSAGGKHDRSMEHGAHNVIKLFSFFCL